MAFKMKGFTPFTKKDKLSKKQAKEKARRTGDEGDPEVGHGSSGDRDVFTPANISSKGSLSSGDQRKIQNTIKQQGHFGDIPPSLMKGYQRGTPEHRRRVAEINAHHHYLSHANPYNKERMEGRLQEKLANLEMNPDEARNQPYKHPSGGYTS